jgi:diguanylate cyclase (GGDEF)-like protein
MRTAADRPLPVLAVDTLSRTGGGAKIVRYGAEPTVYLNVREPLPGLGWRIDVMVPAQSNAGTIMRHGAIGLLVALLIAAAGLLVMLREIYQHRVLEAAIRDPLTGLYSRMYMNETLPRLAVRHNQDRDAGFAAIILDLDNFKQINDRFSHMAGDRVLSEVGRIIGAQVSDTDIPVRLGGEEMVIFRVGGDPGSALRLAERLRLLIADQAIRFEKHEILLTVSGGVARHRAGETLMQLLRRADDALYRAKAAGRNRIYVADADKLETLIPALTPLAAEAASPECGSLTG